MQRRRAPVARGGFRSGIPRNSVALDVKQLQACTRVSIDRDAWIQAGPLMYRELAQSGRDTLPRTAWRWRAPAWDEPDASQALGEIFPRYWLSSTVGCASIRQGCSSLLRTPFTLTRQTNKKQPRPSTHLCRWRRRRAKSYGGRGAFLPGRRSLLATRCATRGGRTGPAPECPTRCSQRGCPSDAANVREVEAWLCVGAAKVGAAIGDTTGPKDVVGEGLRWLTSVVQLGRLAASSCCNRRIACLGLGEANLVLLGSDSSWCAVQVAPTPISARRAEMALWAPSSTRRPKNRPVVGRIIVDRKSVTDEVVCKPG